MEQKIIRGLPASTLQLIINQLFGFLIFYVLSRALTKSNFGELNWSLAVLLTAAASSSLVRHLAALMPEKAQAILARAHEYAYSRVVCGAHYPSDIEASHVLGTELAMLMLENPAFHTQFLAARDELRSAGLTGQAMASK